jgi:hypothetical protein
LFDTHFPGLGLLNLAHSLRCDLERGAVPPFEVAFFDEEAFETADELIETMKSWLGTARRRIVAASTYTVSIQSLQAILERFEPHTYLIVVGGAHASTAPDIDGAHLSVRGEGGAAMRHVLSHFLTSEFGTGEEAKAISFACDRRVVSGSPAFDRSIQKLPSPGFAYDLLPPESEVRYATGFLRWLGHRPQLYVCTQSCRARCTFCSTYLIHGRAVARPLHLVEQDLEYLVHVKGHDSLEFHDDDLMQHPELDGILKVLERLRVPWFCYARVDIISPQLAAALSAAGCRRVFLGIESMNQDKLDYFNKCTTVEGNVRAVKALAEEDIGTIAGFIVGAPDDDVDSVLSDLDTYLDLPLFALGVSVLSPDAGTVEFLRARKSNLFEGQADDIFGGDQRMRRVAPDPERWGSDAPYGLPTVCENLSKTQLNILRQLALCEFYFRPNIWAGLTSSGDASQVAAVRSWYQALYRDGYGTLMQGDAEGALKSRLRDLRGSLAGAEWLLDALGHDDRPRSPGSVGRDADVRQARLRA